MAVQNRGGSVWRYAFAVAELYPARAETVRWGCPLIGKSCEQLSTNIMAVQITQPTWLGIVRSTRKGWW